MSNWWSDSPCCLVEVFHVLTWYRNSLCQIGEAMPSVVLDELISHVG